MRKKNKKQDLERPMDVERGRESNTLVDVKQDKPSSNTHIEKNKKSATKYVVLAMLALIVIVSVSMYAWAKYKSSLQGNVNSQVAKWSFKVNGSDTSTIDILDFPITRTDENSMVDSNTIAPRNIWSVSNRHRC